MYLVPVAAVIALLFAAYLAGKVGKQDAGTDRMKEIEEQSRKAQELSLWLNTRFWSFS